VGRFSTFLKYLARPGTLFVQIFPVVALTIFSFISLISYRSATMNGWGQGELFGDYRTEHVGIDGLHGDYGIKIKYARQNSTYPPVIILHGTAAADDYLWRFCGKVTLFPYSIYEREERIIRSGLAQSLVDLGFDVVTYTSPDSAVRPLEECAVELSEIIEWTKDKFDAEQVVLIGHSQGGLVVRYYVESDPRIMNNYIFPPKWGVFTSFHHQIKPEYVRRLSYKDDVAGVFLLGTPNYGINAPRDDYATTVALVEQSLGSEFIEYSNNRYEEVSTKLGFPPYFIIYGTAYEDFFNNPALDFGDGVVTVESAVGPFGDIPSFEGEVTAYDIDHYQLVSDGFVVAKIANMMWGLEPD